MGKVEWVSGDTSLKIELGFNVVRRMKIYHVGKAFPIHTQCVLTVNGIVEAFETVIKHSIDENNPKFAHKLCAERVLKNIGNKWVRSQVRIGLNKYIENLGS